MVSRFWRQREVARQGRREARYGVISGRLRTPHGGLVLRQKCTVYCRKEHLPPRSLFAFALLLARCRRLGARLLLLAVLQLGQIGHLALSHLLHDLLHLLAGGEELV